MLRSSSGSTCKLKAFSPPTCSKTHIHLRTADWSFMTFLWWLCHYRLVQTSASSFPTIGNINVTHARSQDVGWWWHHYPWSSAHSQWHHHTVTTITVHTTVAFVIPLFALMKSMPLMKSPRSKFIWTYLATQEWLHGFSLNLRCTLCHWRFLQTHDFQFPILSNNNMTDTQNHEARQWWCHYPSSQCYHSDTG